MSGGGSQVTAATPWGPASSYLTDIMAQARQLYGQQTPNYANPSANFGYGQATGAVGNAINGTTPFGSMASSLSPNTTAAIQKQLSGVPDYTAVKQSLDAANQQTWDSFNNTELPQLNQRASFLGNPSGSIKDLNWATANIGKNMDLNAQQQYLGEYDRAQTAQANAAGLGANIAQGAGSQQLQGANLYQSLAQMPNQSLADYASAVSGTGGKFGTSTETNKAGAGQTAANVIGGLTAGAGLVNTLTGTPVSSGIPGAYNAMFGGGTMGASAGTMAGVGSDLAASTAASEAGVAGDVAASNAAWLGSSAGSGAGAAGLGAAGDAAGSAAGTAGATAGGEAAAAGGEAAAGGADAAGAGAGGSGFGSTLAAAAPYAAAALAVAAPFYGLFAPATSMSAKYYSDIGNMLNKGRPSDQSGQYKYDSTVAELTQSAQHGDKTAISLANQYGIPWQSAGITPANYVNYSTPGGAGRSQAHVRGKY